MCRVGVYSQHSCDQLAKDVRLAKGEKLTPVSYLMHKFHDFNYQQVRDMLGRFGLEGHHHEQEIDTLSGGQKSRVVFVELGMARSHLLLLDEPTNHLDLETVDCLVKALKDFAGGVMVITHNMSLINAVCKEIWVIENDEVVVYPGEFEEYRDGLAEALALVVDEDPEEKRRQDAEKKERDLLKEQAAVADGTADPSKPKSKAQHDKERADARKAKDAKDAAAAAAKQEEVAAAEAARTAEASAVAAATQATADAKLKRESDLARAAIAVRGVSLADAMAQLVAEAADGAAACGGLLVLLQLHAAATLLEPLLRAILEGGRVLDAVADGEDGDEDGLTDAARLVLTWQQPLGWLVCKCDDLAAGQRQLIGSLATCVSERATLIPQAAPLLKAFWQAELLQEGLLLQWAAGTASLTQTEADSTLRRFAAPLIDWLGAEIS